VTTGGINERPEWSADGGHLLYSSNRDGKEGKFTAWKQVYDGSAPPERLYRGDASIREIVAAPDGRSFVVRADATVTRRDIYRLDAGGDGQRLEPLVTSPADELMPRISPNGRWLAYVSDESGQQEVYVRQLGNATGRIAISSGGGSEPVWARDGTHLFYRNGGQMIEATLVASPSLTVSSRRTLFEGAFLGAPFHANYDVMPDNKSFVMVEPVDEERPLVVVLNWREELRRRIAGKR
jgi:Tol biopolymer transport system component